MKSLYRVLRILLWFGAGGLILANISPYIQVARLVFADSGGNLLCTQLGVLPLVGGILRWACSGGARIVWGLGGVILWAIVQTIELLPIMDNFDIPTQLGFIKKSQDQPTVKINESDGEKLKRAKEKLNSTTDRSHTALVIISILVYMADVWMMFFWLYPPVNKLGGLDPGALIRAFLSVFGTELILLLIVLVNNVIDPTAVKNPLGKSRPAQDY